jgi:hypothetical protein
MPSINDLQALGTFRNGTDMRLNLVGSRGGGHALLVGMTRSGKTHFMGMGLAALVECDDAAIPLVADIEKMCLDFAHDPTSPPEDQGFGLDRLGVEMLTDITQVASALDLILEIKTMRAQRLLPMGFHVVVPIDEFASVLDESEEAKKLVGKIARGALAVKIVLLLGAQRATGDFVPAAVRLNTANTVAFRTGKREEARYIFGEKTVDVDCSRLAPRSGRGFAMTIDVSTPTEFQAYSATRGRIIERTAKGLQQPTLQMIRGGWTPSDRQAPLPEVTTRGGIMITPQGLVTLAEPVGNQGGQPVGNRWATDPDQGGQPVGNQGGQPGGQPPTRAYDTPLTPDDSLAKVIQILEAAGTARLGEIRHVGGMTDRVAKFAVARGIRDELIEVDKTVRYGAREMPVYRLKGA